MLCAGMKAIYSPETASHVVPCISNAGIDGFASKVSSHGKAYVYAVDNLVTGLPFGARRDDFDFRRDSDVQERPVMYECYPGAFASVFGGKSCAVYELRDEGFQRRITGWSPEHVCESAVAVQQEYLIPNLYERLRNEQGRCCHT